MRRLFIGIASLFLLAGTAIGQLPKHELRSAWLTTVWALDWPKNKITQPGNAAQIQAQKQELISLLNLYVSTNMNAVYFQVRSRCDAMYASSYEPWSSDLGTPRGVNPGYDPLAFAIEEAHKRGLELHAWINPYRYSTASGGWGTSLPQNYEASHPDWLMVYPPNANNPASQLRVLNPGIPEVRKQLRSIVGEIVHNYDVDGIVFDDYFYGQGTQNSMDDIQYQLYNPDNLSPNDWRRQNVNRMIREVRDTIKSLKPHVKFGVSPAGVAASDPAVAGKYGVRPAPVGTDWQYNGIYAEPLAWLSEGTIDYISPQIYWTIGHNPDYAQLSQWWSEVANKFGKHFYASHSLENLRGNTSPTPAPAPRQGVVSNNVPDIVSIDGEPVALSALSGIERAAFMQATPDNTASSTMRPQKVPTFYSSEIGDQIGCNRTYDLNGAPGSVFYRSRYMFDNTNQFVPYLTSHAFAKRALPPAIQWQGYDDVPLVSGIVLNGTQLTWNAAGTNLRYTVYAIPNDKLTEPGNFAKPDYLLGVAYTNSFTLPTSMLPAAPYTLAVAPMDRYGNEFSPQLMDQPSAVSPATNLLYPADNAEIPQGSTLQWHVVPEVEYYLLEVAENNDFTRIVYSRELTVNHFSLENIQALKTGRTYYWRIKARKANAPDGVSEVRRFSLLHFGIVQPANAATDISLTPTISWVSQGSNVQYRLEIAASNNFATLLYTVETTELTHTIPSGILIIGTTYYVRIKASGTNLNLTSEASRFTTQALQVPKPAISKPLNNATIQGTTVEVCWEPQVARRFQAELSENQNFSGFNVQRKTINNPYTYCTTFTGIPTNKTYYVRVSAEGAFGGWNYSDVVTVTTATTSQSEVEAHPLYGYLTYDGAQTCLVLVADEAYRDAVVQAHTLTGVLIATIPVQLTAGHNIIPLGQGSLPKGIYPVSVRIGEKNIVLKTVSR